MSLMLNVMRGNTGHHNPSYPTLLLRFIPPPTYLIFDRVPYRLPAKHYRKLAIHFPVLPHIHRIMHPGCR